MEMHQLRYAVAVARSGNFSRAAEQCRVAQPSLSQQIMKLEEELGERLFDRTKRETKLTPHGEVFLRRAVRILEEVDAATREAHDAKELISGVISIGVIPTIAPYLLPDVMAAFAKDYPGVEIIVQEETTGRLLKLLQGYDIDFALVSPPLDAEGLEMQHLLDEELLLALPRKHPLASRKTVSSTDLEQEKLILMKEGHCLGDQVLSFCNRREIRPKIRFRSAQLETIQSLIAAGMGISLIPAMAAFSEGKTRLTYRSLRSGKPQRSIVAVWPKQRPPGRAASQFLKMIVSGVKSASIRSSGHAP